MGSRAGSGDGKVWFAGQVGLGELFSLSSALAGDDDFPSNTFITIYDSQNGSVLQTINFHTSCSQPLSEDDQYGAAAVEGIRFKNGITCGTVKVPVIPVDCCDEGDKPNLITFRYTGEGCSATTTGQPGDKYSCTGDPNGAATVYIVGSEKANGDGKIWFTGEVGLGEVFSLSSNLAGEDDFPSNTFITIYASEGGAVLQSVNFHTSCSQPLSKDDQYGASEVVGIRFKSGYICGTIEEDLASLGDRVFLDQNGNGLQDTNEPGVPGVPVELQDCFGNTIESTTTDANGNYLFDELEPGGYVVVFGEVAGYKFTDAKVGTNNAIDSDAGLDGTTTCIELGPKEVNLDVDAGIYEPAALGDRVFEDRNGNGLQDTNEPGVPGVPVELQDCFGNTIESTTTDANGNYLFDDLKPGSYVVVFGEVPGYKFADPKVGSNDEIDSDAGLDGATTCIELENGEENLDVDAGIYKPARLGDRVFIDKNGDGLQTPGERGVPWAPVELRDCNGNTILIKLTDERGNYIFDDLKPGGYVVVFGPFREFEFTEAKVGSDDTIDSDAGTGGATTCIELESGEENLNVDAGVYELVALGDYVWFDANASSIQEPDEVGIPNITVELYDGDRNFIRSTTTDENGYYLFSNLPPKPYIVRFIDDIPEWEFSKARIGGDPEKDSNANPSTGFTNRIFLNSGDIDLSIDAGLCPIAKGRIGDYVWRDANANGLQDQNETGIPNVSVELYDCFGNFISSMTTDANGYFLFKGLLPGGYRLRFIDNIPELEFSKKQMGTDPKIDSDADPTTGFTDCITLTLRELNPTVDAGLCPTVKGSNTSTMRFSTGESNPVMVRAYPNPIGNQFSLAVQSVENAESLVSIFNPLGQEIYTQKLNGSFNELNISSQNWINGIYLVKVTTGEEIQTLRIMKQ